MPRCVKLKRKKRQACIGDLDTEIILQDRDIASPLFGSPDFSEDFTDLNTVWAGIETVTGKTYFDGAGVETPITHSLLIRFDATVTAETWIEFDGRRLDILAVQDLEERHEFLTLTCTDRGLISVEASKI